jgi:hypothetical protein
MRPIPRLLFAIAIGVTFAAYEDWFSPQRMSYPSDFTQPRLAARVLLDGENPYEEIGPGRPVAHPYRLVYPMPSAIVAMPFTFVSQGSADALFIGLGAALLAWALTAQTLRNPQLLALVSFPMFVAAQAVQWSPIFTAATLIPWLGAIYACKPSVALAYLLAYPSRIAVVSTAVFVGATVLIWPSWVPTWLQLLPTLNHMSAPVTRWGGPLLLLAFLKWRRPEARLLGALACIPQTPMAYEALPLFLLVQTIEEGLVLLMAMVLLIPLSRAPETVAWIDWMHSNGQLMIWLAYLPALGIVLRRPNVAPEGDPFVALVDSVWQTARSARARFSD